MVNQLDYELTDKRAIDPYHLSLTLQQAGNMAKLFGAICYNFTVAKNKTIECRIFGGAFLAGSVAERGYYAFRPSGYTGAQDYLFEGNYIGRNTGNGLGFSQFMEKDGNLKTWTFLTDVPDWMVAVNVKSPSLFILPVKVFADVVVCDQRAIGGEQALWDAGLNIALWKDILEVYFPIAYSKYINDKLELNGIDFYNRIRFTLNIHKLVPKNFIHDALNL
jgi:hypothetical protein